MRHLVFVLMAVLLLLMMTACYPIGESTSEFLDDECQCVTSPIDDTAFDIDSKAAETLEVVEPGVLTTSLSIGGDSNSAVGVTRCFEIADNSLVDDYERLSSFRGELSGLKREYLDNADDDRKFMEFLRYLEESQKPFRDWHRVPMVRLRV